MARKKKPCVVDGCERPKCAGSTRWCYWHWLARQSMTDQVTAAQTRLERSEAPAGSPHNPNALHPLGPNDRWCLDCQSVVPAWYVHNGKRCLACESGRLHGKRVEKTYGISAAEYAAKLAEQDGRCAICRGVPRSKRLAVDHNHKTGAVRGLLCKRCNHDLLGAAHDSIEMLERAVGYLEQYEEPNQISPLSDPMDPKCVHGIWMVSKPGRSNYCEACHRRPLSVDLSAPTGCTDDPPF